MRIDDFLSTVGVVKRRTVAKELATSGLIECEGRKLKASHQVKPGEIISIKGSHPITCEVLELPHGSIAKDQREKYVRILN